MRLPSPSRSGTDSLVLAVRIGLGVVAALRATLIYGEVGTLATEPVPVPRWVDRLVGLDPLPLPAPAPAEQAV